MEQSCSMDTDDTEITDMDYESSQPDDACNNGHDNEEHWFCFDDSTVTPVTRQHIEKHYGQSDCAYMLFYRQKNRRQSMTNGSIEPWLMDEIAEKNRVLDEKR